jgi:hypothetical protein
MSIFVKNLEDLSHLSNKKVTLVKHLQKNYRENIHYVVQKDNFTPFNISNADYL